MVPGHFPHSEDILPEEHFHQQDVSLLCVTSPFTHRWKEDAASHIQEKSITRLVSKEDTSAFQEEAQENSKDIDVT